MSGVEIIRIGRAGAGGGWQAIHGEATALGIAGRVAVSDTGDLAGLEPADLLVAVVAPGLATSAALRDACLAWAAAADGADVIELSVKPWRVLMRGGRAMIETAADPGDALAAIVAFHLVDRALRADRDALDRIWEELGDDLALTHAVGRRDLRKQARVNARTRMVGECRLRLARGEAILESPPAWLQPAGRRLFMEMAQQARLADRMRATDLLAEAANDVYERANGNLTEFRAYRNAIAVDAAIFLAILAELVFFIWATFVQR